MTAADVPDAVPEATSPAAAGFFKATSSQVTRMTAPQAMTRPGTPPFPWVATHQKPMNETTTTTAATQRSSPEAGISASACPLCGRPLLAECWHESAADAVECATRDVTAGDRAGAATHDVSPDVQ